jgi:hypothetical protein
MSRHHEVIAVAPPKPVDPREVESNYPEQPLQDNLHPDGFKEEEQAEQAPQTASEISGEPPTEPPTIVAPPADDPANDGHPHAVRPSPLDGKPVFDLPQS